MRAAIIAGGAMDDYAYIRAFIRPDDLIVCADSGYRHAAAMGLSPHMLVGDMDSLGRPPEGVATLLASPRKDLTDTELAIDWARAQGADEFMLLGATGWRMDHALTNVLMLVRLAERGERAVMVDEYSQLSLVGRRASIDAAPGTLVSLVPVSECAGVVTEGLEYPLAGATLHVGSGRGVSNVVVRPDASVSVQSGTLLLIIARDRPEG